MSERKYIDRRPDGAQTLLLSGEMERAMSNCFVVSYIPFRRTVYAVHSPLGHGANSCARRIAALYGEDSACPFENFIKGIPAKWNYIGSQNSPTNVGALKAK